MRTMRTALVACLSVAFTTCRAQPVHIPPPPIPSNVKCGVGGAGTHRLSWAPLASADVYEVEVGLSEASAVHTPLASTTTATAAVSFAGLDVTKSWWFKVRAHAKAGTGIGTDVEWSDFSSPIACEAVPSATVATAVAPQPGSRYTLMYRVSEVWGGRLWGRTYAPPDFLASYALPSRVVTPLCTHSIRIERRLVAQTRLRRCSRAVFVPDIC